MKITDYKIGTRLALAFGAVLLLSVGSAGLALKALASVEWALGMKASELVAEAEHEGRTGPKSRRRAGQ